MKLWSLIALLFLISCGGSLNDEQRKKLRERMKEDEIKHVSEGELMTASLDYGRAIGLVIQKRDPSMSNPKFIDSLENAYGVKIRSIEPGDSALLSTESQLIEAFISGVGQGAVADDVQKMDNDSILYTKPITQERPDGSVEFMRALSIHMPVRSIVLSIQD